MEHQSDTETRPCIRCGRDMPMWESAPQCMPCFLAVSRAAERREGQERTLRRLGSGNPPPSPASGS